MEIARITGALELDLGKWAPTIRSVKIVLNGKTPHGGCRGELVNGTKLDDPAVRKKLMEGGEAAVAASTDPMIVLARKLDPMRREFIKWMQDNVQSVEQRAGEKLGKARFAVYGKTTYPDATFTLRLSYGTGERLPDERHHGAAEDDILRTVRPRRQLRFQSAVQPALALRGGRRQAGSWRRR